MGRNLRLCALVAALLSHGILVSVHVQTVVRQEGADAVADGCWDLVNRLQLLKPVLRAGQSQRSRLLHQTKLGVDVVFLLLLGERMPCLPLELVLAFLRRGRRRRRRRWRFGR